MTRVPEPKERFVYRASGLAVGGRITAPAYREIPGQAAVAIGPDGGHATSRVDAFSFEGFLHVAEAHGEVRANPYLKTVDGEAVCYHRTVATVTLRDLDIDGVVTADKIVGRIVSERPCDSDREKPLSVIPSGSYFVNLRIHGEPVAVSVQRMLLGPGAAGDRASLAGLDHLRNPYDPKGACDGRLFSIFEDVELPGALGGLGVTAAPGCRIVIPDFGKIVLGERHVTHDHQMLTMLRAELGSPRSGFVDLAVLEGDGHFP